MYRLCSFLNKLQVCLSCRSSCIHAVLCSRVMRCGVFLKNTVIFFSLHALNLPCKFFQFLLCWLFLYEKLKTLCLWWAGTGTILNVGVRSRSFHQLFLLVRHAKSSSSRELLFFRVIVILLIVQHE